jgi:hypothetical protein
MTHAMPGSAVSLRTIEMFAAMAMTLLAVQKLRDVESFSTMFLNYDLLAGGVFARIGAPIALFIGTVGAVSVFKAVYIDKRELKCACVGGSSNVPLGFVSLTENLVMMAMGIWMLIK